MSTVLQPLQWPDNPQPPPPSETLASLIPASFHESDEEDSGLNHIPIDIYQHFGLSPGTPICLDSLQDPAPGEKPAYTYATLVKLAIWSSPQRKLTLSGIYEALEKRFAWFRECENPNAWKTSIRHSLSLLSVFVKLPMDIHIPGKGCNWTIDFSKGDGYKRPRKRGSKKIPKSLESPISQPTSPSSSAAVASPSERSNPADPSKGWIANPQAWQTAEERSKGVFAPYGKAIPLEEVSPDPQFRHYRMCTYLYPGSEGPPVPASAKDDWELEVDGSGEASVAAAKSKPDPPAKRGRPRTTRPTRRANPMQAAARQRHSPDTSTHDEAPTGDEVYFCPSAASFQAYQAATTTYPGTAAWNANDAPAGTTTISPNSVPTNHDRRPVAGGGGAESGRIQAARPTEDIRYPDIPDNVIDPALLDPEPSHQSISPPSDFDFEEEDT